MTHAIHSKELSERDELRWKRAQNKRTAELLSKVTGDDQCRLNNAFEDRSKETSPTILTRYIALQLESKRPIEIRSELLSTIK